YSLRYILRRPPYSPLFPYTTLFRSLCVVKYKTSSTVSSQGAGPVPRRRPRDEEVPGAGASVLGRRARGRRGFGAPGEEARHRARSEEHTSELQSPDHLVCRLLLEKK